MIKQTFYNLPEAKKNRIIDAIKSEFNEVPSNRISINHIIKKANISRGSFYQYFDDKGDLYEIIATDIADNIKDKFLTHLSEQQGDIFKTFRTILDDNLISRDNIKHKKFRGVIPVRNLNTKSIMDKIYDRISNYNDIILANIDTSKFISKDKDYINNVFSLLLSIFRDTTFQFAFRKFSNEEVKECFEKKLQIIQYGCLKE
ncbi:MAG: TetR/AcrR family transcriptional regulator [Ruminococcus sp.]|nr:TetR/AcrR family transcriptional regulator [Ruminococcus sp.]